MKQIVKQKNVFTYLCFSREYKSMEKIKYLIINAIFYHLPKRLAVIESFTLEKKLFILILVRSGTIILMILMTLTLEFL